MSAVLRADSITVVRDRAAVVDDVSLVVDAGELVAVIGPNGAGKSTLLRVLAGDVAPSAGRVLLGGTPLSSWNRRRLARARAVLPQDTNVAFGFRVRDVVAMGRAPWAGTPQSAQDAAHVAAAMAATDVADLAERYYPTLSGGERARVALARVLAQDTRVVLLDEPTAALDLRHQEHVLMVARRRADAGDAVLVVLHDIDAAIAYADRLVVLSDGAVVGDGPPAQVCTSALLTSVYGWSIDVMADAISGTSVVRPRRGRRPSEVREGV